MVVSTDPAPSTSLHIPGDFTENAVSPLLLRARGQCDVHSTEAVSDEMEHGADAEKHVTFPQSQVFFERSHSHQKRSQKRKLTIFGNTKQVIQDYDTVFDYSIPFRKNDLLRITHLRMPGVPGLHFVPWHRGSGCLGAAAPVTGAAADEHNLNVVDCDASVTVARRSSMINL